MRIGSPPLSGKDLVAHVIPGVIVLALAVWFLDGFVGLLINLGTLGTGIVALVLWLVAAYVAGVFVQVFSGVLAGGRAADFENRLAADLISDGDIRFSPEFKRELQARTRKQFGGAASGKELFPLCRDYVAQHGAAGPSESVAAFGDMFRGILATARIGIVISVLIALKHAVLLMLPFMNIIVPVSGFVDYETVHLVMAVLLFIIFVGSSHSLKVRMVASAEESVAEIYTNFVALTANEQAVSK